MEGVLDGPGDNGWPYFPQVADGGGYTTEFILLISPKPGWGAGVALYFYSDDGAAWKTEP